MKTRNLVLGICALVLAVGSAFASLNSTAVAYQLLVHRIPVLGNPSCPTQPIWTCVPINGSCIGSTVNCKATVTSPLLPGGFAQANVRDIQNCSIIKLNQTSNSITTLADNCIDAVQ